MGLVETVCHLILFDLFETLTTTTILSTCAENSMWVKKEVDEFAANLLIEVLEKPKQALNPRLNPFNPVGVIENLQQSGFSRFVCHHE